MIFAKANQTNESLEGYVQIVENQSLPVVLTNETDPLSLELATLIRGTPILQVRIFDESDLLQLRVQNSSQTNTEMPQTTFSRTLEFEGKPVGRLEIDLDISNADRSRWLESGVFALLFSLIASVGAIFLLRDNPSANLFGTKNTASQTIQQTAGDTGDERTTNSGITSQISGQLLVLIKTGAGGEKLHQHERLETLSKLSRKIQQVAKLYSLQPISITAGALAFSLDSDVNRQSVHRAAMLGWGLSKVAGELKIQTYLINLSDITTPATNTLAFWSEIDESCSGNQQAGPYLADSLRSWIDDTSFELGSADNAFHRITSASDAIEKLWNSQQSKVDSQ